MYQNDLISLGATRIPVGLSAIVAVRPTAYSFGINFKIASGGGSLEVVSPGMTLSGAGVTGWGGGYLVGDQESVQIDGPCTFYLAATGATMVACMMLGRTAGATYL